MLSLRSVLFQLCVLLAMLLLFRSLELAVSSKGLDWLLDIFVDSSSIFVAVFTMNVGSFFKFVNSRDAVSVVTDKDGDVIVLLVIVVDAAVVSCVNFSTVSAVVIFITSANPITAFTNAVWANAANVLVILELVLVIEEKMVAGTTVFVVIIVVADVISLFVVVVALTVVVTSIVSAVVVFVVVVMVVFFVASVCVQALTGLGRSEYKT